MQITFLQLKINHSLNFIAKRVWVKRPVICCQAHWDIETENTKNELLKTMLKDQQENGVQKLAICVYSYKSSGSHKHQGHDLMCQGHRQKEISKAADASATMWRWRMLMGKTDRAWVSWILVSVHALPALLSATLVAWGIENSHQLVTTETAGIHQGYDHISTLFLLRLAPRNLVRKPMVQFSIIKLYVRKSTP